MSRAVMPPGNRVRITTALFLANVLVYRGRVIGGDICTADVSGFVRGFDGKVRLP